MNFDLSRSKLQQRLTNRFVALWPSLFEVYMFITVLLFVHCTSRCSAEIETVCMCFFLLRGLPHRSVVNCDYSQPETKAITSVA